MEPLQIGQGNDLFHFTIKLEHAYHLESLLINEPRDENHGNRLYWLSYEIFGVVIQTPQFPLPCPNKTTKRKDDSNSFHHEKSPFLPVADTFCIQSSKEELEDYLRNNMPFLKVYVCSDGAVFGSITMDISSKFQEENGFDPKSLTIKDKVCIEKIKEHFLVEPLHMTKKIDLASETSGDLPSIGIALLVEYLRGDETNRKNTKPNLCEKNTPSDIKRNSVEIADEKENDVDYHAEKPINENDTNMKQKNDDNVKKKSNEKNIQSEETAEEPKMQIPLHIEFGTKTKRIGCSQQLKETNNVLCNSSEINPEYIFQGDLERKRREWEEWRHQQELQWHVKLREKEECAMRVLEERAKMKEKERVDLIEASRLEYVRMESKLKKALAEIETKELHIKNKDDIREIEYKRKQLDLDAKLRIMREEAKHMVELERTKAKAQLERAEAAEASVKTVQNRIREVETEFQRYKDKQHQTPEAALLQQVAILNGKLAEAESRIQRERAERNQAFLEKEQYRTNIYRLSKALRREKEKNTTKARKEAEELRLEYKANEQRFVLDGDRAELERIKNELNNLCSQSTEVSHHNIYHTPPRMISARREKDTIQDGCRSAPIKRQKNITYVKPNVYSPFKDSTSHTISQIENVEKEKERKRQNLLKEKENLLATGVYDSKHPIIMQLESIINLSS